MIDMHNHVLFGVDDGCKTLDESIQMIEAAIKNGVTDIICTPHYAPNRGYVASNSTINKNFEELKNKVQELDVPIKLYLGREIDEMDGIENILNTAKASSINNTKYVLVDFGMRKTDIDEYCYELILHGYIPIVAHPERYNYIKDLSEFKKWKRTGALLQINATSLLHPKNKNTKKQVTYLLKQGLVDLIGSDCHRNPRNYEDFKRANDLVKRRYKNNVLKPHLLMEEVK